PPCPVTPDSTGGPAAGQPVELAHQPFRGRVGPDPGGVRGPAGRAGVAPARRPAGEVGDAAPARRRPAPPGAAAAPTGRAAPAGRAARGAGEPVRTAATVAAAGRLRRPPTA